MQQWNVNVQWEFMPNWLVEVGYVGSKGSKLLQLANQNQPQDVDALGFLPRPGVPGGGFFGNYYEVEDDEFVNLPTPAEGCDLLDDPGECVIPGELRGALLGLDEDEGANSLLSTGELDLPLAADDAAAPLQPRRDVQRQLHVVEVA